MLTLFFFKCNYSLRQEQTFFFEDGPSSSGSIRSFFIFSFLASFAVLQLCSCCLCCLASFAIHIHYSLFQRCHPHVQDSALPESSDHVQRCQQAWTMFSVARKLGPCSVLPKSLGHIQRCHSYVQCSALPESLD